MASIFSSLHCTSLSSFCKEPNKDDIQKNFLIFVFNLFQFFRSEIILEKTGQEHQTCNWVKAGQTLNSVRVLIMDHWKAHYLLKCRSVEHDSSSSHNTSPQPGAAGLLLPALQAWSGVLQLWRSPQSLLRSESEGLTSPHTSSYSADKHPETSVTCFPNVTTCSVGRIKDSVTSEVRNWRDQSL